jgi:CPA1 family monovalent cation:H+ antiporter
VSGVLAVVSGALLLSSKRQQMLSYQGRVQGSNVWSTIGFVLNGIVFMLIGLQLPSILNQVEAVSLWQATGYGLLISVVLIITRILSTLGAAAFTRFIKNYITVADPNPGWDIPLIFGWAGMRGVVSLAAAFSIPLVTQDGTPFPYRNLILFTTFIVILVTLVFQGLTLPWVIRKIKPKDRFDTIPSHEQEAIIQKKIAKVSMEFLEAQYANDLTANQHLSNLHARFKTELTFFEQTPHALPPTADSPLRSSQQITLKLLEQQRGLLNDINKNAEFDEEVVRKYLSLIDLEEFKIREKLMEEQASA